MEIAINRPFDLLLEVHFRTDKRLRRCLPSYVGGTMPSDVHPAAGFTGGSDVTGCLSGLVSGGFGASLSCGRCWFSSLARAKLS